MTKSNDIQLITTEDGSSSLLNTALGETYHSRHGAMRESNHVFIQRGLSHLSSSQTDISLLEIGFGTGLNAWLTWLAIKQIGIKVHYTTLETRPLDSAIIAGLNYTNGYGLEDGRAFLDIHDAEWDQHVVIDPTFGLHKIKRSLQEYAPSRTFDLIYYDAFGPPVQPEMWTVDLFHKLWEFANPGAVFVTYCAKGQVRRDLQNAGWEVERLPGPPGKREMLRATKTKR